MRVSHTQEPNPQTPLHISCIL